MDPVGTVQLDATVVADARRRYPGYLRHYPELYARGWSAVPPERAAT